MIRYLYIGLCMGLLWGCGTENPFSRGPETIDDSVVNPIDGGVVSFSAHVIPALSTCVSCHRSGAGGWTYDGGANAYASVLDVITRNDPPQSVLLIKATGGDSHGGGTLFSVQSPRI